MAITISPRWGLVLVLPLLGWGFYATTKQAQITEFRRDVARKFDKFPNLAHIDEFTSNIWDFKKVDLQPPETVERMEVVLEQCPTQIRNKEKLTDAEARRLVYVDKPSIIDGRMVFGNQTWKVRPTHPTAVEVWTRFADGFWRLSRDEVYTVQARTVKMCALGGRGREVVVWSRIVRN